MIVLYKNARCGFCGLVGTATGPSGKPIRICAICAGQATGMFLQASVDPDRLAPLGTKPSRSEVVANRPAVRKASSPSLPPPAPSGHLRTIIKTVAHYYGVLIEELTGKRRTKLLASMRDVAMFLCKQETQASSTEICAAFGGRDHTLLRGAVGRIESRAKAEPALSADLATLKNLIYNAISIRNLEAFAKGAQG